MQLAGEHLAFLNMPQVSRYAHVRHAKKRVGYHAVDFKAVASLLSHIPDEALQRRVDHCLLIKTESRRPDRAGHQEERPPRSRQFEFEFVRD